MNADVYPIELAFPDISVHEHSDTAIRTVIRTRYRSNADSIGKQVP